MVPITFVLVITHHFGWLVVYHSCNFLILVKKKVESIYTILFWILKNGYVNPNVNSDFFSASTSRPPTWCYNLLFCRVPPRQFFRALSICNCRRTRSTRKKSLFFFFKELGWVMLACLLPWEHSKLYLLSLLPSIDPLEMENRTIENLHQIRHYPASVQCAWCRTQKWRVGRYHHGRW